jgi:hypothetical protein
MPFEIKHGRILEINGVSVPAYIPCSDKLPKWFKDCRKIKEGDKTEKLNELELRRIYYNLLDSRNDKIVIYHEKDKAIEIFSLYAFINHLSAYTVTQHE